MDVLRRLLEALVPGGVVVDLLAVPPNERVEVDGEVLGELDSSVAWARARQTAAGLDHLVERELLLPRGKIDRFAIVTRYPTGRDAVEDVNGWASTTMPEPLARRVEGVAGPVTIREHCLVRSFAKRG